MSEWLMVFSGMLAALVLDRTIVSAVQVWSMRRIGKHLFANIAKAQELRETTAKADYEQQRKRVAN